MASTFEQPDMRKNLSSLVSPCSDPVINVLPKPTCGRKGLVWIHFYVTAITVHHRRNSGQKPAGRNCSRSHGGEQLPVQLPGLLPVACSACLLRQPGSTSRRKATSAVSRFLTINHYLRKCHKVKLIGESDEGDSPTKVPSSHVTLVWVMVAKVTSTALLTIAFLLGVN